MSNQEESLQSIDPEASCDEALLRRRGGRRAEDGPKPLAIAFRTTHRIGAALESAAAATGRSRAREVEERLRRSLSEDGYPI